MTRVEPNWEEIAKRMEEECQRPSNDLAVNLSMELTTSLLDGEWVDEKNKAVPRWKLYVMQGWANELHSRLCKLETTFMGGTVQEEPWRKVLLKKKRQELYKSDESPYSDEEAEKA